MGNQAVSLLSFALFRSAVPVGCPQKSGRPPFHSPLRLLALIFTRSLPTFGGAITSTIQSRRKSRTVLCLSPLVFSAVAPSHSRHRGLLRYHFAFELGMPRRKSGTDFLVTPPFHAHTRSVSLRAFAVLPRLWWQFDCRNPVTALLIRKKSSLPRKRGVTFFASYGAWGCLIAIFIRTFPKKEIKNIVLKKIKKESKAKFRFQKVKFKPCGFSKKSPPAYFHNYSSEYNHTFYS